MDRLRIATYAMAGAALMLVAAISAWTLVPVTTRAIGDRIGEMAVAYNDARLERDFEQIYPQYRSRLPVQIDDRTTLVDLSWRGHVFRLRHLVEPDTSRGAAPSLAERNRKAMTARVCADGDMRATMKRGAIYEYQYHDRQSRLVASFDIRNADCET